MRLIHRRHYAARESEKATWQRALRLRQPACPFQACGFALLGLTNGGAVSSPSTLAPLMKRAERSTASADAAAQSVSGRPMRSHVHDGVSPPPLRRPRTYSRPRLLRGQLWQHNAQGMATTPTRRQHAPRPRLTKARPLLLLLTDCSRSVARNRCGEPFSRASDSVHSRRSRPSHFGQKRTLTKGSCAAACDLPRLTQAAHRATKLQIASTTSREEATDRHRSRRLRERPR